MNTAPTSPITKRCLWWSANVSFRFIDASGNVGSRRKGRERTGRVWENSVNTQNKGGGGEGVLGEVASRQEATTGRKNNQLSAKRIPGVGGSALEHAVSPWFSTLLRTRKLLYCASLIHYLVRRIARGLSCVHPKRWHVGTRRSRSRHRQLSCHSDAKADDSSPHSSTDLRWKNKTYNTTTLVCNY